MHQTGHLPGKMQFILVALVFAIVPDRKRFYGSARSLREQRRVGTGIDSPRQKHSDGHITHLLQPDRSSEFFQYALCYLRFRNPNERLGVIPYIPVPVLTHLAVLFHSEPASCRQFLNAFEQGHRRGGGQEREVVIESLFRHATWLVW